jgi:hypothetical protein
LGVARIARRLIQINFKACRPVQSAGMQIIDERLADIDRRIADAEHRLTELESSAMDRALAAVLVDNVAVTLKLLRQHKARLEQRVITANAT